MKSVAILLGILVAFNASKAYSDADDRLVANLQKNICAPKVAETGAQKVARHQTELEFYRFMSGKAAAINTYISESECNAPDTCAVQIKNLEATQLREEEYIKQWVSYIERQNAILEMKNSGKVSEAILGELQISRSQIEMNLNQIRQDQTAYQNSISQLMTGNKGKLTPDDESKIQSYSNLYAELEKAASDYQAFLDWIDKGGVGKLENNTTFDAYVGVPNLAVAQDFQANIIQSQGKIEQIFKRIAAIKKQIESWQKQFTTAQLNAMALKDFDRFAEKRLEVVLARENFQRCGLSSAELYAIFDYTGDGYAALNKSLRSGSTEYKTYLIVLNNALTRLSTVSGRIHLHRGASFRPEVIATLLPGKFLSYEAPVSTSLFRAFSGKVEMEIKGKRGRFVGPYSSITTEQEVLFPVPTRFKIIERVEKGDGNIKLQLEEVGPDEPPKARLRTAKKPARR